ncbi:B9 protein [Trichomonas vaginalis G3]|uniref:B9 domain-containing protein 1 n=1 Tax=Trichomonas vaginalis (strain ATCC PRA-98 / G3) TaxID=412133 RepID=A2GHK2_TRIV3|nr:hedgehog receptor protein [Trichomonas vaginalis G3]EAX83364.1 B9 protein [Trichomonas vaginalis G3]KAI5543221.1 hedgehog receptor protein [Trichomonas vaginalis G3]|eukprot:XP_001296294.1 B9 protein [Trichomonas vaginalis G3]
MAEQKLILTVEGQVECCTDPKANGLFFTYGFSHGPGWSIAVGAKEGTSQASSIDNNNMCIWNYPFNVAFKAERPFGWPQMVFAIYGKNAFGSTVVAGYGAIHLPTTQGLHKLEIPLFAPASTSLMQKLIAKITGQTTEFINLNFIAGGEARDLTRTESQGTLKMTLNVLIGGTQALDLIL